MSDPVETSELLAFAKAVEAKSLSRAAAELRVPRATISRRLARLEQRLRVRLLRRTTRSLALTDAGDAFYRHARIALDAVSQAEESVRRSSAAVSGTLRVSLPPIQDPSIHELLCDFARKYPDVSLHVVFSTAYADLRSGGFDVAIRASMQLEPGLVARTLAKSALLAVASPAYLKEHGTPRTARQLREHRLLLGFARGEIPQTHWPLVTGGRIRVESPFVSNEILLLAEAAARGLGIALLPTVAIGERISSGELVQVLAGIVGAETRVSVVYAERELLPPQVRAFIEAVVAWGPAALGDQARVAQRSARRRAR